MDKLRELISGDIPNYIAPFLWLQGESDEKIVAEIEAIYRYGIKALCVESRTHAQFCQDEWWEDLELILRECQKRGMKVWLLDDKHFPTGYANGLMVKKYPYLRRYGITERHVDVTGPVQNGAVLVKEWMTDPDDRLLGVIACERIPDQNYEFSPYDSFKTAGQRLTGHTIDLTANVRDGMAFFDLPEGGWRIVYLIKTKSGINEHFSQYIDMMQSESTDILLEAVYEPHYQHFKEYFGDTFAGFFSDEPEIGNNTALPFEDTLGKAYTHFPYADCLADELKEKLGENYLCYLPALWFDMGEEITPKTRKAFMDVVTNAYKRNFCDKLGDWCRAHGVMYIGHVIEDANVHTHCKNSAGHYFRGLDGQDMAGIDVVLNQIVPGQTEYISASPTWYEVADPVFFQYALAKLGSSHSHIQPLKQGHAMCEIFGAYGWAEGTKMMKWLCDHMLVRGINYFVPHAFTSQYPNLDCPPHFYAQGNYTQGRQFGILMGYLNRLSHLFSGGVHSCSAAILYHAEAEWSGGNFMYVQTPAKELYDHQLDYDIVPIDYLLQAAICGDGTFRLSNEIYPALVIPYSEYLPISIIKRAYEFAESGVQVIYVNKYPIASIEGEEIATYLISDNIITVPLEKLHSYLRSCGIGDVTTDYTGIYLRHYHYQHENTHVYMLTNEDIHHDINCIATFQAFDGGTYLVYDAMENKLTRYYSENGEIELHLPPYNSTVFIFGADMSGVEDAPKPAEYISSAIVDGEYAISLATQRNPNFVPYTITSELTSFNTIPGMERFAGHICYDFAFDIDALDADVYLLDLGYVGECAAVYVNDTFVGDKIVPPYTFDITKLIKQGENQCSVIVSTHLGYRNRDEFSKYLLFEPTGMTQKAQIKKYRYIEEE